MMARNVRFESKVNVALDRKSEALSYRAKNFLIAPDRALPVKLMITLPRPPASAPARASKVGAGHTPKN